MSQERRAPRWRALGWGLPFFGGLAVVAASLSIPRIEDDLGAKVRRSLTEAGFSELNVDMSGRDAEIVSAQSYPAGSSAAIKDAAVQWGVRRADVSLIEVPSATNPSSAPSSPTPATGGPRLTLPVVFAEIDNNAVILRGSYADQSQHDRLLTAAKSAYGIGAVTDQLRSANRGEDAPTAEAVAALATALTASEHDFVRGQVAFNDGRLVVDGVAADPASRDRLLDMLKAVERNGIPVKSTLSLAKGSAASTTSASTTTTPTTPTPTTPTPSAAVNDAVAQLNRLLALKPVLFQPATAEILSESLPTLEAAAAILASLVGITVNVEGHTDSLGADQLNQQLSEERASAVQTSLVRLGVPEARLSAVGYGEGRPIAGNDTESGRQANRRVQFSVKS